MDYNLENLEPERFQKLCQALLVQEFAGVQCFPVGQPDGGRDAIRFLDGTAADFHVFQIKFVRKPLSISDPKKWLLEIADGEIQKVARLKIRGAKAYFLITNLSGSGHLDAGSIDIVHKHLDDILTISVGIPTHCWWRDDLISRLDRSWDIKLRYPEILTGQDFLRLLLQSSGSVNQERRQKTIAAFLADQYLEDVEVKFKQVELYNKLLDLFIDLPFRMNIRAPAGSYQDLLSSFGRPLRVFQDTSAQFSVMTEEESEYGTATLLLSDVRIPQVVMEGAPGQGKSTLAQYLCQVHRIRWLNKHNDLKQLPDQHKQTALRLPLKVDLRDLAIWLSGQDPFSVGVKETNEQRSLETFLAHLVRHHSGGFDFDVNDLIEVSKLAPFLLVLDGLDEVADIKQRGEVVSAVTKALARIRENCPDLKAVITSRPAAFANSPGFDRQHFPHLHLGSVTKAQISKYAASWMSVRNLPRKERTEFEKILSDKMDEPHLRDLARNPMQLAILLSLIHTRGAALPDKRTSLYDAYVELFFSREAGKSPAVRQHLDLLKDIHRYLAWVLHSSAETGRTGGRISSQDLREVLEKYLRRELYNTAVLQDIFGAMLERVVMIVSRIEGTYEFEVQPLREYFAARYLYDTASYSPPGGENTGTKPDRFDAISRNFYWLNVVRFYCGCFSKGELLDLVDRVRELARDPIVGRTRHPVVLAAMLLGDWVFSQSPKAIAELTSTLATRKSVTRLASGSGPFRDEQVIQVPQSSGGIEIVNAAFELLEHKTTHPDFASCLIAFIKANSTKVAIAGRWAAWIPSDNTISPARWISYGRNLGCLQDADCSLIKLRIGSHALSESIVADLYTSSRIDCMLDEPRNISVLTSYILNGTGIHREKITVQAAPLYLLPHFLGMREAWSLFRAGPGDLAKLVDNFRSESPPDTKTPAAIQDITTKAYAFSQQLMNTVGDEKELSIVTAERWEELVEWCRKTWGNAPAIIATALTILQLRRAKRTRTHPSNLIDDPFPLCHRMRMAKRQRNDAKWWAGQLARVRNTEERMLFNTLFFLWAPLDVVFSLTQNVEQNLSYFTDDEWRIFVTFSAQLIDHNYSYQPKREQIPVPTSSSRYAFLVALRDLNRYGGTVFSQYFRQQGEPVGVIAEFRQAGALDAALTEELPWSRALAIIRETYSQTEGTDRAITRVLFGSRRPRLPPDVINEILENSMEYPFVLWGTAESILSEQARKAIKPVSSIAKKQRWFVA
jgi:hypothetical protein